MGEYVLAQAMHSIYYTEYCLASLNKLRRANNAFITQQYNSITFRPNWDTYGGIKTLCPNKGHLRKQGVLMRTK